MISKAVILVLALVSLAAGEQQMQNVAEKTTALSYASAGGPGYGGPGYGGPSYDAQNYGGSNYGPGPAPYGGSSYGSAPAQYGGSSYGSAPAPYGGAPSYGASSYGAPSYGASSYGAPSYGASSYGAPSYGAPMYGASSYGAPMYGASSYGTPSYGESSYGRSSYGKTYPSKSKYGSYKKKSSYSLDSYDKKEETSKKPCRGVLCRRREQEKMERKLVENEMLLRSVLRELENTQLILSGLGNRLPSAADDIDLSTLEPEDDEESLFPELL